MSIAPSVGTASGASSSGTTSLTTPNQSVSPGAIVYVQVAMYGAGLATPTVSDVQTGRYVLLRIASNGSVCIWVFRRVAPVSASSSFNVTVTPSSSSSPLEVVSIEVVNDGGLDVAGVASGTGTVESVTQSTTTDNELIVFLGADNSATFSSWGSGQTGISGYPSPPSNVTAWGSYQSAASPGSFGPMRNVSSSTTWVAVFLSIAYQTPWPALAGKPGITVSPIGLSTSPAALIANNGADFGPDTAGTTTSGIQEAVNSALNSGSHAGLLPILLLPGNFVVTPTSGNSYGVLLYSGIHIIGSGRLEYVNAPGTAQGSVVSAGQANMTLFKANNNGSSPISRVTIESLACGTTYSGVTAFDFTWPLTNAPLATGIILRDITVDGASTGQVPFTTAAIMDGNDESVIEDWYVVTGDIQWQSAFPKLINVGMVPPVASTNSCRMILNGQQVLVRDCTVSNVTFTNTPVTDILAATLDNVYMANNNTHPGNITCKFTGSGQVGIDCLRLIGCFLATFNANQSIFYNPGTLSGQNLSIYRLVAEGCWFDTLSNSGATWVGAAAPATTLTAIAGNGNEMLWKDNSVNGSFGTGIVLYGNIYFQPRPAGFGLLNVPPLPSSGSSVTNNFASAVEVYVYGGTGTSPYVQINGTQVAGTLQGRYRLEPGDGIAIWYSGSPTWMWYGD